MFLKNPRLQCIRRGWEQKCVRASIVTILCDVEGHFKFEHTVKSLDSIQACAPKDSEIIVIGNNCSSKLAALIAEREDADPRIVGVTMRQNLGCVAKNFGYNLAQGEYICSIDGDVVMQPGLIEKIVDVFDHQPTVGLIGPCGGTMAIPYWTAAQWSINKRGYENPLYFGEQTGTGKDGILLDTIPSMCWGVRKACFDLVGYLDWRFGPLVGSDADFCFRVKLAGWDLMLVRFPIQHLEGGGGSRRAKDTTLTSELTELKVSHLSKLYTRWFPRRTRVCEKHRGIGRKLGMLMMKGASHAGLYALTRT